ncbi:MAG TPA: methyltransferase domain-containing protein [Methylibium sp.]|uniref:methyltransferase domain-containing protein n=1 Tax=Methylibium sp. TaxID=2067992 RepID=UPI002DBC51F3|nr:methyltransferase domain-containing protein [Methylibium sp.]HEU4457629.1 methyltransferase domain-containing protein [Methylibium sp.]
MSSLPDLHLCVMQPAGYVHALGFVDQARFLRHQFRRFGARVTIAKNRLREDAVNLVFGAHLGFPVEWTTRHACVFFNLEQLGAGGAKVSAAYLELLRTSAVADYDAANVAAYLAPGVDAADVPIVPFLHAPYLGAGVEAIPLEQRPIDLLFFGSMNERRAKLIERIEAGGTQVALFDAPLYGPERDDWIRQSKAVLNMHFYESSRFEQVRASHCLSLGTPVISERGPNTLPPAAFEDTVFWFDAAAPEAFFAQQFKTAAFFDAARTKLEAWRTTDATEAYADLLAFACGFAQGHAQRREPGAWRPKQVNLGSGKDYKPGWLNLDVIDRAQPDLVLDLGREVQWPVEAVTRYGSPLHLAAGSVETIYANNVLEHVPDLPLLMTNLLALLAPGGTVEIEVPYERALTAWQDPTHLRAMNENSWLYYTDWFWYLGWFEHRFEIARSGWLDVNVQPCPHERAAFMRITLRKIETTPRERTVARTMRADFALPDDELPSQAGSFDEPGAHPGHFGPAQAGVNLVH